MALRPKSSLIFSFFCCFYILSSNAFSVVYRQNNFKPQVNNPKRKKEDNSFDTLKTHTRQAIEKVGTEESFDSLKHLRDLCLERRTYEFDDNCRKRNEKTSTDSVVSQYRRLLPLNTTYEFLNQVRYMESNGWLSINPDSVDELPSLHLNLISQGKPLFPVKEGKDEEDELDDFQQGVQNLLKIVEPYIDEVLLPHAREVLQDDDTIVSDVFLRRYGEDICGDKSRDGLSAHYDVFSKVTAVIALDDVSANGTNGLYTTVGSIAGEETSNHASLRRFFPLERGDAVLHTWDVLHGVNVESGLDRTSLIVWFSSKKAMMDSPSSTYDGQNLSAIAPWISQNPKLEYDPVVQFVYASALESAQGTRDSNIGDNNEIEEENIAHEYYLRSTMQKNPFGLTRIGTLLSEGQLSTGLQNQAENLVKSWKDPPVAVSSLFSTEDDERLNDSCQQQLLARRFWLEAALQGNPLAQISLGDEAMEQGVLRHDKELKHLAATLFGLAAQQEQQPEAEDALQRVISYEASSCENEEEFLRSPILKIAKAVWNV